MRLLLGLSGGGLAHFELPPGHVSSAVAHRTVEEIWYILSGRGQMWRKQGDSEVTLDVYPGLCLTIPVGTHFQFRCSGFEALAAIAVTMPPWPGPSEAVPVAGEWPPTVGRGREDSP